MTYEHLAKMLGITVQELGLTEFYNQEIFNGSGIAVQNEFMFSKNSPKEILNKIKGLGKDNRIILDI
jgi:hypothetical protein